MAAEGSQDIAETSNSVVAQILVVGSAPRPHRTLDKPGNPRQTQPNPANVQTIRILQNTHAQKKPTPLRAGFRNSSYLLWLAFLVIELNRVA
ncbi:hypothetical protein OAB86_02405 [Gammaproteobacteria bacterium]|nr:hypothetical protein [Gammaproteobacteria bacterium]